MSLSPVEVDRLKAEIIAAHRSGDRRELERLQAIYRSSVEVTSSERGVLGTARLITTPGGPTVPTKTPAPAWEKVELRETSPAPVVELHESAADTIRLELRNLYLDFDSEVETGGWLFARPHRPQAVLYATGPGEGSRHWLGQLQLTPAPPSPWADLAVVGCWHCHPGSNAEPSRTDMEAWAAGSEWRRTAYVSVIALRSDSAGIGWMEPRLHAFLTHHDNGRPVCEPARLIER